MTTRVDTNAIRAALADATPGPWEWDPDSEEFQGRRTGMSPDPELDPMVGGDADAHLIADAPTWLADLCDVIDSVAALHVPRTHDARNGWTGKPFTECAECSRTYPCPTRIALDGGRDE